MPPKVQLSFTGETPDTRSVVMSDYGSVGLTGRPFDIWMQMDLGGGGTGGGGVGGRGAGGGAAGYSVQGFDAPFSKEYVFLLLCLFPQGRNHFWLVPNWTKIYHRAKMNVTIVRRHAHLKGTHLERSSSKRELRQATKQQRHRFHFALRAYLECRSPPLFKYSPLLSQS